MKKLIFLFLFAGFYIMLPAQNFAPAGEYVCGENVQYFTGDAWGNIYIVYENGNFLRIDSTFKRTSIPGKKIMGDVTVDTKNPFKIQLFNADEQTITFYNREFTPSSSISFLTMDIAEVALSCASSDDAFWVLEENGLNLIRYSSDLIKLAESRGSEIFGENLNIPEGMQESGEFLLIWQKNGSAFILDKFGNLRWQFPGNADYYALNAPHLYFINDGQFTVYHLLTHKEASIALPLKNFEKIFICENHFYFLISGKIYHYKLK